MIIFEPVHTAVWPERADGAPSVVMGSQEFEAIMGPVVAEVVTPLETVSRLRLQSLNEKVVAVFKNVEEVTTPE